jgi:copper resistance protein B
VKLLWLAALIATPAIAQESGHDHGGHEMPATTTEPPVAPSPDHAGHEMPATTAEPPVGPPPPEASRGPEDAADTVWGKGAMEPSRTLLRSEHGHFTGSKLLVDQLETRFGKGRDGYALKAEAWIGGDIDKAWLKTEIEGSYGEAAEQAEVQALWSHAIGPWFDLQAGVRLDAEPRTRGHLVLGVQGLAPWWIEVDGALFLSDRGDVTLRAEAGHDLRITQKLILQPRAELDFALQDVPRQRLGAGLSLIEVGARLRYEIVPQFGPYVGVSFERAIGDSRRFRRLANEDSGGLQLVAGVRAWF